jgi:hypothetical protein
MGQVRRLTSSFTRLADTTLFAVGDEISNSAAAGSVVRPTFDFSGMQRARLLGMGIGILGSTTIIIAALNFDVLLWKTNEAPAAVGNNVTWPITGLQRTQAVGRFLFDDGGWQNTLGAYAANTGAYQYCPAGYPVPIATPTLYEPTGGFIVDFTGQPFDTRQLTAGFQVLAALDPGVETDLYQIVLDVEEVE